MASSAGPILTSTPPPLSSSSCVRAQFVVMACDGVWDVMTSQQVVNFVRRQLATHGDVAAASRALLAKALDLNSIDNVTAVVIAVNCGKTGGAGAAAGAGGSGGGGVLG